MGKGAALSEVSSGEGLSHFAAIRVRVNGTGQLKMSIQSLDDIRSKTLIPFNMLTKTRIEPTRIINFTETRASVEIKTTEKDEVFRINRIIVFMKESDTTVAGIAGHGL